ncbi:hypothetical protein GCM10010301_24690 [Streptomyces plicatus]|nr:hypothetical protein GCM10010301_24690 [Streptomyces plicatus]
MGQGLDVSGGVHAGSVPQGPAPAATTHGSRDPGPRSVGSRSARSDGRIGAVGRSGPHSGVDIALAPGSYQEGPDANRNLGNRPAGSVSAGPTRAPRPARASYEERRLSMPQPPSAGATVTHRPPEDDRRGSVRRRARAARGSCDAPGGRSWPERA